MSRHRLANLRRSVAAAMAVSVVTGLAAIGPARALAPTPVFAPYLNYDVGPGKSVAVADFTGDGRNDVLLSAQDSAAGAATDHVYLFVQGSTGDFARVDALETHLDSMPQGGLAAGDLDGDGLSDAVLATGHSLDLFLQRAGHLTAGPSITLAGVGEVEVADVDGDGHPDLVASGSGGVSVLHGAGGAVFDAPAVLTTDVQSEVQVGDVTGDGRADIVTCSGPGVLVFAGVAGGSFAPAAAYQGDAPCESVALADVNGDGRQDVSFIGGGSRPESRLDVLAQQADGGLSPAATYRTCDNPRAVTAGDTNGDGRADLVVLHGSARSVGVHAQAPDHTLDPERLYGTASSSSGSPKALAVGDVNGDHRPDILIADVLHGLVVLLGQTAAPSTTTSSSILPTTTSTTAPPGPGTPLFDAFQSFDVHGAPQSVVSGDFNGDGRTDLAIATVGHDPDNDNKVFVFYQGTDGNLQRAVRFDTDIVPGADIGLLGAGDIDGDGHTDLVLRMRAGIDVFMQRGGTFADRRFVDLPTAQGMEVADMDQDGKADLVMAGTAAGITVYRSIGAGNFAPPVTATTQYTTELAVGDVTGDGRPDLVTTAWPVGPNSIEVFRQLPDGTFAAGVYTDAGGPPGTIAIGDFNGDGRMDVAVSHYIDTGITILQIRILDQRPDGTLTSAGDISAYNAGPLRAADIDGDGRTDLVALYGGHAGILLQQGDGKLAPEQSYAMPSENDYPSAGLVVADFTGDGRPDVAGANVTQGLDVLRNVGPGGASTGTYHSLSPARTLDTRDGTGGVAGPIGPGATIAVAIAGRGGVPATGVSAVAVNVTATQPSTGGFLTVFPSGTARPLASNLNVGPGQTVPNLVLAKVGADGKVSVYNNAGTTHVIFDVVGWYGDATAPVGGRYHSLDPARVLDTRNGTGGVTGPVGNAATVSAAVVGRGGVPATGVSAVALNVTVTQPSAGGYLTVFPSGTTPPLASNLNFVAGQTVPNLVMAKVGPDGKVSIYNNVGTTHVVFDVVGWYGADGVATGSQLHALSPTRILDTRAGTGAPAGPVGTAATLPVAVTGVAGVPATGVSAVLLNVTVTQPTAGGFLSVFPSGTTRPLASSLNFAPGQTVPNLVVAKVGADGKVDVYNDAGATHVIFDVVGWFAG
ncbi:MAG TPA: VCBS repeat-containing protein [Acidimicrobiales bacterium]|jgi:hypothetical protein|nr:VCBS repeat-containing protein [Acidimicrobiales bacterium]